MTKQELKAHLAAVKRQLQAVQVTIYAIDDALAYMPEGKLDELQVDMLKELLESKPFAVGSNGSGL